MHIAIVGAGPAGSWTAILLAKLGHSVTLIDAHAPWEKPCGGGVTSKVLSVFSIFGSDLPRQFIDRISIHFSDKDSVTIAPQQPLAVVSRRELGRYLLDEAVRSGASFVRQRVCGLSPAPAGWTLSTRDMEMHADFLIGADGASSFVRRKLGSPLTAGDLCMTLGYFVPGAVSSHMKIYFIPSFQGYIWSFPRPDHVSYGLITRIEPGWTSRAKALLSNFVLSEFGDHALAQANFYSAPVPCLRPQAWQANQISGRRWALVGDAAGLVDPITGEGIYYAFRSAEILAEAVGYPHYYESRIRAELGGELARASRMYNRFYRGRFLGGDFKKRTIQFSNRSRTLRGILGDLIAGSQSYSGLKRKLFISIPAIGVELLAGRK